MKEKLCPFCEIIEGRKNESPIVTAKHCFAVLDIKPITPGHTLIIPKIHQSEFSLLDKETLFDMFILAQRIDAALKKSSVNCMGSTFLMHGGKGTPQEFPHVHLHVVPRYNDDGFDWMFPPGYEGQKPDFNKLTLIANSIRSALAPDS